jgi:hypothetical protein
MSSVTRFIRQIPQSNTYYSASVVAAAAGTYCYEFNPSASNTVGNYPPGYMTVASAALQLAVSNAASAAGGAGNLILRDMGKTVQAPLNSLTGSVGFYRQVQLLAPSALTAAQGYNGGSAGNTFGVLGGSAIPDSLTKFQTFYIPATVAGIAGVPVATYETRMSGSM